LLLVLLVLATLLLVVCAAASLLMVAVLLLLLLLLHPPTRMDRLSCAEHPALQHLLQLPFPRHLLLIYAQSTV
jgi:hypothetical protein